MKTIKFLNIIILILLIIAIIVSFSLGGFVALLSIAFGYLFGYYLLIYLISLTIKKNQLLKYGICLLIAIPIVWALVYPEGLINFLMQGIHIDMK